MYTRFRLVPKSMTLDDLWVRFKVTDSLNAAQMAKYILVMTPTLRRVAGCIISIRRTHSCARALTYTVGSGRVKPAIYPKRLKVKRKLPLTAYIKLYTGFRLPPKCMSLNDHWARFKVIDSLNSAKMTKYSLVVTPTPCRVTGCITSMKPTYSCARALSLLTYIHIIDNRLYIVCHPTKLCKVYKWYSRFYTRSVLLLSRAWNGHEDRIPIHLQHSLVVSADRKRAHTMHTTRQSLMPNTHRRRRREETVLSRRRRRCEHNSQLAHDDCQRIQSTIWKLTKQTHNCSTTWIFIDIDNFFNNDDITSSLLRKLSISMKIHAVKQYSYESVWSASKLSTESVGSRHELVANCVHTADADADATKQFRRVVVGGVYWVILPSLRRVCWLVSWSVR